MNKLNPITHPVTGKPIEWKRSGETDVAATFARIRAEQQAADMQRLEVVYASKSKLSCVR